MGGGEVTLDSIAVAIFVDSLVELTNTVSEAKIQITLLILNGNPVEDCCVIDPEFQVLSMIL